MIINALKLTGLLVLTGGPLFYILVCRPVVGDAQIKMLHRYISRLNMFAGGLYLSSFLASGFSSYLYSNKLDITSEYLNLIFAPIFIFCFLKAVMKPQAVMNACVLVFASVIFAIHSTGSHSATQVGLLPISSNVVHLFAAAFWGGGIMSFAYILRVLKFHSEAIPAIWQIAARFSKLTFISLIIILVSGAILTVTDVHSIAALNSTAYGSSFKLKLILVLLLLCLFVYSLYKTGLGTSLKSIEKPEVAERSIGHFRLLILSMSLTALTVIATTGLMMTHTPPSIAPFLTPQIWALNAGQYPLRIEVQPVAGSSNRIRFELFVPDELMQPTGLSIFYSLYIPESSIGVRDVEAIQVSQNSFQGEAIFPMPGSWHLELILNPPDSEQLTGVFNFDLPSLPLVEDLRTYLSYSSIRYSSSNTITFTVGVLLLLVYGWLTWRSQAGEIPIWVSIAGLVGISCGIYLVMSVTLVKTYPSTYWHNPLPYTAMGINEGQNVYMQNCAECHGQTGVGDGPWAIENRGLIPSLTTPHMDIHTDGEIYWWITYGIPSLEMPALDPELPEQVRWQVINYVRSLRHGIPQ